MKSQLSYLFLTIILFLLLTGCAAPRQIQTMWNQPEDAILRIVHPSSGKIIVEESLPAQIRIRLASLTQPYFIEIKTKSGDKLYGTLAVLRTTEFTEMSNVHIDINENIIERVRMSQLSQITIKDPTINRNIIEITLGNRMSTPMERLYNRYKHTIL
jgi:hypothetical protein